MFNTTEHTPHIDDERRRIEATGAIIEIDKGDILCMMELFKILCMYVLGIYRVDGGLELSRALGDLPYRKKGIISKPDVYILNVTEGIHLIVSICFFNCLFEIDFGYVILSSDGVFDKLSNDLICIFAENSKHQCKHFQHWYHPDIESPIHLPGKDTLKRNHMTHIHLNM